MQACGVCMASGVYARATVYVSTDRYADREDTDAVAFLDANGNIFDGNTIYPAPASSSPSPPRSVFQLLLVCLISTSFTRVVCVHSGCVLYSF